MQVSKVTFNGEWCVAMVMLLFDGSTPAQGLLE